jgi:hypothetical protein
MLPLLKKQGLVVHKDQLGVDPCSSPRSGGELAAKALLPVALNKVPIFIHIAASTLREQEAANSLAEKGVKNLNLVHNSTTLWNQPPLFFFALFYSHE